LRDICRTDSGNEDDQSCEGKFHKGSLADLSRSGPPSRHGSN
jgi:hypothetical protein